MDWGGESCFRARASVLFMILCLWGGGDNVAVGGIAGGAVNV